jgi:hypothetical protein
LPGTSSECRTDGNGESDPGERVILSGIGDRYDNADDGPLGVQQRTAGAAGVHGGVELDQPGQGGRLGLRRAVQTGDDAGSGAIPQPEWVADGDHVRTDGDAAAEGCRDHNLRELPRSERRDVDLGYAAAIVADALVPSANTIEMSPPPEMTW